MKAKLRCLNATPPNDDWSVKSFPVVIGRSPDAEVRLDDAWVSRYHCFLEEEDGTLIVRDKNSRNGTLVNGRYVSCAPLLPGDVLAVGLSRFQVNYRRRPTQPLPVETVYAEPPFHASPAPSSLTLAEASSSSC